MADVAKQAELLPPLKHVLEQISGDADYQHAAKSLAQAARIYWLTDRRVDLIAYVKQQRLVRHLFMRIKSRLEQQGSN